MASRKLFDLKPAAAELCIAHEAACAEAGIDLLVYCTLRSADDQARLYRTNRSLRQIQMMSGHLAEHGLEAFREILWKVGPQPGSSGPNKTNAGPGESWHQYGFAYDCVPLDNGKPIWTAWRNSALEPEPVWQQVGELGEAAGLEWSGRWRGSLREWVHFQGGYPPEAGEEVHGRSGVIRVSMDLKTKLNAELQGTL